MVCRVSTTWLTAELIYHAGRGNSWNELQNKISHCPPLIRASMRLLIQVVLGKKIQMQCLYAPQELTVFA
jgi:hypothetical protein